MEQGKRKAGSGTLEEENCVVEEQKSNKEVGDFSSLLQQRNG